MPDTPDLFEPNPLLNQFLYPMGDPILSESCPTSILSSIKARQEVCYNNYLCSSLKYNIIVYFSICVVT